MYRLPDTLVVRLPRGRGVLSSSGTRGGYRTDLEAIYNHQIPHRPGTGYCLDGRSVEEYHAALASRLGINPDACTGLLTAASMEHAAIITQAHRGVEVTAVVTAGVEVNGARAGDPGSYHQEDGSYHAEGGTVNIILLIGARLPPHALVQAVMTATEAKAAALQQLMAPSRYSSGIATGSGTDMIAVVVDCTSPHELTDAGKHAKLGELIGACVLEGTLEALGRQSGLTPVSQRDVLARLERFSIREDDLWKASIEFGGENRKARFIAALRELAREPQMVASVAALLHLVDEISWGLVPETAGSRAGIRMLASMAERGGPGQDELTALLREEEPVLFSLVRTVAWIAKRKALASIEPPGDLS